MLETGLGRRPRIELAPLIRTDDVELHRLGEGKWPDGRPFFWAPGYALFLGVLTLLSEEAVLVKVVQIGIGTLTCALVGLLAARLFEQRRVTLLSLAIAAAYGPLVYYDLQIPPATLDVFLFLLLLVLLLEAEHERPCLALFRRRRRISSSGVTSCRAASSSAPTGTSLPAFAPRRSHGLRGSSTRGCSSKQNRRGEAAEQIRRVLAQVPSSRQREMICFHAVHDGLDVQAACR